MEDAVIEITDDLNEYYDAGFNVSLSSSGLIPSTMTSDTDTYSGCSDQGRRNNRRRSRKSLATTTSEEEIDTESDDDGPRKAKNKIFWKTLEHKGPAFSPPYSRLPAGVNFLYDSKVVNLSATAEEVAGFYAMELGNEIATQNKFITNFFKDWRRVMTPEERALIQEFPKCDFTELKLHFENNDKDKSVMAAYKKETEKKYGYCIIDGKREKIENYEVKPPGLSKYGKIRERAKPEDVTINCSIDSKYPELPPGHFWREVTHNNTVTWLAKWEDEQGKTIYMVLSKNSRVKQRIHKEQFETARKLNKHIDKIREKYRDDCESTDIEIQQRGVALYLIDILESNTGYLKDETSAEMDVQEYPQKVDSVDYFKLKSQDVQINGNNRVTINYRDRYVNYKKTITVDVPVYNYLKDITYFPGKLLFSKINSGEINRFLKDESSDLNLKAFRTYLASVAFEENLEELPINLKTSQYVLSAAKSVYIDPRIVIAWCKQNDTPMAYYYSGGQLSKFKWAVDEIEKNERPFVFREENI